MAGLASPQARIHWGMVSVPILAMVLAGPGCGDDDSAGGASGSDSQAQEGSGSSQSSTPDLSGNIIVATTTTDAVIMFDSDGNFEDLIYTPQSGAAQVVGVAWDEINEEVIISLDAPDHVIAVDPVTKESRVIYLHAQLNGTIRGVTQMPLSDDFVVVESNCVERFDSDGQRVLGAFPLCGLNAPQQLNPLSTGGFIACSTGTDDLRLYDESANLVNSVVTGSDPYGCVELQDGRFAVGLRTNDEIRIYSSDLSTLEVTFDNATIVTDARGLAVGSNGNILVTDVAYDRVIEIDLTGSYVRDFGGWILNDPVDIIVIP